MLCRLLVRKHNVHLLNVPANYLYTNVSFICCCINGQHGVGAFGLVALLDIYLFGVFGLIALLDI